MAKRAAGSQTAQPSQSRGRWWTVGGQTLIVYEINCFYGTLKNKFSHYVQKLFQDRL